MPEVFCRIKVKIYFVYSFEYLISGKFRTVSSKTVLRCFLSKMSKLSKLRCFLNKEFMGKAINNTLHNKPTFSLNH